MQRVDVALRTARDETDLDGGGSRRRILRQIGEFDPVLSEAVALACHVAVATSSHAGTEVERAGEEEVR